MSLILKPVPRWCVVLVASVVLLAGAVAPAQAQVAGAVEAIAPVLAAEDARAWDDAAYRVALTSPDSIVRRTAAISVGRMKFSGGVRLLAPLLIDRDSTVRASAIFALGLLGDTAAVERLIERLRTPPTLDPPSASEAMTALARIGGARAAEFLAAILQNRAPLPDIDRATLITAIAQEAWRLGRRAPIADLLALAGDTSDAIRSGAVYSLARLKAPAAGNRLVSLVRDPNAVVRASALRALTRSYADSAHLAPGSLADLAAHAVDDEDAAVRITALRTLATFHDPKFASRIAGRLSDPAPAVRVQTAMTLGDLGGPDAVAALLRALAPREVFAVRSQALIALARIDTAAARAPLAAWRASANWSERGVAADAALAAHQSVAAFVGDADPRVAAAALQNWVATAEHPTPEMIAAARSLLGSRDAAVRSVAADVLSKSPDTADVPSLIAAYGATSRDSFPEAALSALNALAGIARASEAGKTAVERDFLNRAPRPADYLVRRWAEASWPEAARRWGPAYPVATGRTLQDYREIARRYLFGSVEQSHPHVIIETADRGNLELELLGGDAPLTVANFLGLVDRHYFDGNRWHRVIPNFVVQDGDRRGDGWGGPGGAIRDEVNRLRYDVPMLGMALSGPDTGASQWFINLSAQPHLDGIYTVFGRVVGNIGPLYRITQGDLIRTIRR